MTFLGAILSILVLLTTIKVSLDVILADPEQLDTAVYLIMVGSTLSAVVLFWQFDISMLFEG